MRRSKDITSWMVVAVLLWDVSFLQAGRAYGAAPEATSLEEMDENSKVLLCRGVGENGKEMHVTIYSDVIPGEEGFHRVKMQAPPFRALVFQAVGVVEGLNVRMEFDSITDEYLQIGTGGGIVAEKGKGILYLFAEYDRGGAKVVMPLPSVEVSCSLPGGA